MADVTSPSNDYGTTLIEYYKLGHQQLLATMQKRDKILYLNLIAQAILLALSLGISVGPTTASMPRPDVSLFAIPIAFVFTLLYVVEDGAVTSLSSYLSDLCHLESKLNLSFEGSSNIRAFLPSVFIRMVAQVGAFCIIPYFLAFQEYTGSVPYVFLHWVFLVLSLIALGYAYIRKHLSLLAQTKVKAIVY
jgi:hypothetical protein